MVIDRLVSAEVGLTLVVVIALFFVVTLMARPALLQTRAGIGLALAAFLVLPVLVTVWGTSTHLEAAKTTQFCLSCHEMESYGRTLELDDPQCLPASHVQNKRVPAEVSCYTCHTTYTMFGDVKSKLRGLRHLWVHAFGPVPEKFALYEPYRNQECLHCHGGARVFEESEIHADIRAELASGDVSCLDCHDLVHPIDDLDTRPTWSPPPAVDVNEAPPEDAPR